MSKNKISQSYSMNELYVVRQSLCQNESEKTRLIRQTERVKKISKSIEANESSSIKTINNNE